jgi:hypothetical protein
MRIAEIGQKAFKSGYPLFWGSGFCVERYVFHHYNKMPQKNNLKEQRFLGS